MNSKNQAMSQVPRFGRRLLISGGLASLALANAGILYFFWRKRKGKTEVTISYPFSVNKYAQIRVPEAAPVTDLEFALYARPIAKPRPYSLKVSFLLKGPESDGKRVQFTATLLDKQGKTLRRINEALDDQRFAAKARAAKDTAFTMTKYNSITIGLDKSVAGELHTVVLGFRAIAA